MSSLSARTKLISWFDKQKFDPDSDPDPDEAQS
jgi:hypothetical protein